MNYHQVQVDQEVFEYVKKHAEPLVDTFNSALRRILGMGKIELPNHEIKFSRENKLLKIIPAGTPRALAQILKVIQYVLNGKTRIEATHIVAKEYNVAPQTVIDKYCRQLGLTASKFDFLLSERGLYELKKILKNKFKSFGDIIDDFLD